MWPLIRCAVSDTGPMISVFQSDQIELLKYFYDHIYIPSSTLPEYQGIARVLIQQLIEDQFVEVCELEENEKREAQQISIEIANHPLTRNNDPRRHYPEAEAIELMSRRELRAQEILLDEQAAREVARTHGLSVVGFAGVLFRACTEEKLISAERVRHILSICQSLGTHYSTGFIEGIYNRCREELE